MSSSSTARPDFEYAEPDLAGGNPTSSRTVTDVTVTKTVTDEAAEEEHTPHEEDYVEEIVDEDEWQDVGQEISSREAEVEEFEDGYAMQDEEERNKRELVNEVLNHFTGEDQWVIEEVQKSMASMIYDRGRYSPTREQGVHHFHRMIDRFLS